MRPTTPMPDAIDDRAGRADLADGRTKRSAGTAAITAVVEAPAGRGGHNPGGRMEVATLRLVDSGVRPVA